MNRCILVNKTNPIKESLIDKIDFIETNDIFNNKTKVESETYKAFCELQDYLLNNGLEIGISSAFRSFDDQRKTYEYYLNRYGSDYCDKYVAPIGCSEHHTGLAIDFYVKENNGYPMDDDEIKDLSKYLEIHKLLHNFGFILRYPEGKEEITGYNYEPWHIRYVGKTIAKEIFKLGITFEEYKEDFSGVIVVNKEKGMTSFDVVNRISKLFGIKRVGHTGTLDPMAEGVLIVCIGKACKIVELLTASDKEYIAEAKLGIKTDTYDIEGKVLEENKVVLYNIDEVLTRFKKTYMQEVPVYSAVKVDGRKLYVYARNNIDVELPKKEVTIKEIELLDNTSNTFKFRCLVTKGCYIRSLINDIGNSINCGAVMTSLIRTKQGNVSINDSYKLSDIENGNYKIYSIEEVLDYPKIVVDSNDEFKISNGVKLDNKWDIKDKVMFFNKDNKLLGIYEVDNNLLKVWKNFG